MKKLIILALVVASMSGCPSRVRVKKHGYPVPIPDCAEGLAFVPVGCYVQNVPEGIEVRCPKSTTKYSRCAKP